MASRALETARRAKAAARRRLEGPAGARGRDRSGQQRVRRGHRRRRPVADPRPLSGQVRARGDRLRHRARLRRLDREPARPRGRQRGHEEPAALLDAEGDPRQRPRRRSPARDRRRRAAGRGDPLAARLRRDGRRPVRRQRQRAARVLAASPPPTRISTSSATSSRPGGSSTAPTTASTRSRSSSTSRSTRSTGSWRRHRRRSRSAAASQIHAVDHVLAGWGSDSHREGLERIAAGLGIGARGARGNDHRDGDRSGDLLRLRRGAQPVARFGPVRLVSDAQDRLGRAVRARRLERFGDLRRLAGEHAPGDHADADEDRDRGDQPRTRRRQPPPRSGRSGR